MIDINKKYKKMSKELLRRKMKEVEEFEEWRKKYAKGDNLNNLYKTEDYDDIDIYKEPLSDEAKYIRYMYNEWLKEFNITLKTLINACSEEEENFMGLMRIAYKRGWELSPHQKERCANIVDKCKKYDKIKRLNND